ncbi:MAG: hypothetical protein AMXMBFR84_23130 [Candidatus Hydrogenedentota bacterium]
MMRHPSKADLLAHAEGLVDGGAISAEVARHVAKCPACAQELQGLKESFAFLDSARELEPTLELTNSILSAARSERQTLQSRRSLGRTIWGLAKTTACAAAIVTVCAVSFQSALADRPDDQESVAPAMTSAVPASVSADEVKKSNAEVQTLAAAVSARNPRPQSVQELRHARLVLALEADMQTAREALQRNPGCERADLVLSTNIKRQAQALKNLYLDRTL